MKARVFDSSIEKFISSLDKKTGPKVVRTIGLLEEYGPKLGMPHAFLKKSQKTPQKELQVALQRAKTIDNR